MMQFSSSADGVGRQWALGEQRMNQLVFIGKDLEHDELTAALGSCLVQVKLDCSPLIM